MATKEDAALHLAEIDVRIADNKRISDADFFALEKHASLHQLAFWAHHRRQTLHPENNVTYIIDRNINYTNICIAACQFCAFYAAPGKEGGYLLSFAELEKKIAETKALGGQQILLQGGLHPDLPLTYYEEMLQFIREQGVHIHAFSPPEIHHFAQISGCSIAEVITRLRTAGLCSIPGGGAEILNERVRQQTSPRKCSAAEWLAVMEEAHRQGLRTTATMMFGHCETIEERLEHLRSLRQLQDRTGGFTAFIPWPFQPENTQLAVTEKTSGFAYLRMLALSRIYLDNFANIQASWVTQGAKVAQLALHFGANDFGSTMIEENVVAAAGVHFRLSEQEIRRLIQEAGFKPRQRRMDYSFIES